MRNLLETFIHRARVPVPTSLGEVLLTGDGVSVQLGGRLVLDDVSISVRAGEVLALVGPNGAGKSTLLSALAGDLATTAGTVSLAGHPISTWTPIEKAMRRAVLPQSVALSFPFTCAEVIEMGRTPWAGTASADDDDRHIAAAIAQCQVAEFGDRPFNTLSGGERARVALAKTLAQQADVIFLDEPTAALDIKHQELVLGICRAQAAAGRAVVVVLHDLALAAAYADRVAILDSARLVAVGAPAEVFTAELLTVVYQHEVEVFPHPANGSPMIIPQRS